MATVVDDFVISVNCSGPAAGIFTPAKTGGNVGAVDGSNLAGALASIASYGAAVQGVSLGKVTSGSLIIGVPIASGGPTVTANRGSKWIVSAEETTGDFNKFTYTIPAADPSKAIAGTNVYDPTNAAWTAFVSAFNGLFFSPAGNALTFTGAKLGGRRR